MAEYVERKFTAAKLSVALAVAAMLGGLAARDSSAGAATPAKGPQPHLAEGSITTAEVKDHSLLFQDIKAGEVFSKSQANRQFVKLSQAKEKWLTLNQAADIFAKIGDLASAVDAFIKAENAFVKIDDANKTFVKIDDAQHQFVNGDGKVMTGFEPSTGAAVPVLDVPGLVLAEGLPAVQGNLQTRLTNEGATPLHYAVGGGGGSGVIAPGKTQAILISGSGGGSITVQLISEGSPPAVGTLTVGAIPAVGTPTTNFSAQILIGAGL
jgi:hypothetical protein